MKEFSHLKKCKFGKEDIQTLFILNLLMRLMIAISEKRSDL